MPRRIINFCWACPVDLFKSHNQISTRYLSPYLSDWLPSSRSPYDDWYICEGRSELRLILDILQIGDNIELTSIHEDILLKINYTSQNAWLQWPINVFAFRIFGFGFVLSIVINKWNHRRDAFATMHPNRSKFPNIMKLWVKL